MNDPTEHPIPTDEARADGRLAAEAFVRALELEELREREQRLAELAWRPGALTAPQDDAAEQVVRLEARVRELSRYVRAVHESRPWRFVQGVRRLLGRGW